MVWGVNLALYVDSIAAGGLIRHSMRCKKEVIHMSCLKSRSLNMISFTNVAWDKLTGKAKTRTLHLITLTVF